MDEDTPPSDTLVVHHFPNDFSDDEKQDFFRYFGAVEVKILKSKIKKYGLIFARFPNKYHASAVLQKIHQSKLGASRLSVEFAKTEGNFSLSDQEKRFPEDGEKKEAKSEVEATPKSVQQFLNLMNNWLSGVNFKVPPPCHLRYQYPPPSPQVLENIAKALAAVPKFYTQVLHLMNKMNLPSPFEQDFPIICDTLFSITKPSHKEESNSIVEETKDEESELESDEDSRVKHNDIIPHIKSMYRKQMKLDPAKVLKSKRIEKTLPTSKRKKLKTEHVFEASSMGSGQKSIQVKLTTPDLNLIKEKEVVVSTEDGSGFGILKVPSHASNETERVRPRNENEEEATVDELPCITAKELAENRLSKENFSILPVFKNYSPGTPSCRLYLKNLAKKVSIADLQHIYRRYYLKYTEEEQGTMFDVRLMQEGRMKGQAFINLQTVEQAKKALEETNGYILKDKPMVVQFARCAPATKTDTLET